MEMILKYYDFGPPLHVVIVPAELHLMEREYLERFAGLQKISKASL